MITWENVLVSGWEAAIRGMRNPLASWDKIDSEINYTQDITPELGTINDGEIPSAIIGENDIKLMWRLRKAGSDHAKYMRYINVTVDINAPLYWWKEADTYKVGTVRNSTSTMHTIMKQPFDQSMFSLDRTSTRSKAIMQVNIDYLNDLRNEYMGLENEAKIYEANGSPEMADPLRNRMGIIWNDLIQMLPSSWMQMATMQFNYEVLRRIYFARLNHKLEEWRTFCRYFIISLPYSFLITGNEERYKDYLNHLAKDES